MFVNQTDKQAASSMLNIGKWNEICIEIRIMHHKRLYSLALALNFPARYPCRLSLALFIEGTVLYLISVWECSGSVVECLTRDREAAGSSLTGVTALLSLSKTHLS